MPESTNSPPHEAQEVLIDSLIAISLLTRQMAQALNAQIHQKPMNTQKGEIALGRHERSGYAACHPG